VTLGTGKKLRRAPSGILSLVSSHITSKVSSSAHLIAATASPRARLRWIEMAHLVEILPRTIV
jgi:hypothetical protein